MAHKIDTLRERAIADFFDTADRLNYNLDSDEAKALIGQTADSHIPQDTDTLWNLAKEPYKNNLGYFFFHAVINRDLIGYDCTVGKALEIAISDFLQEEIEEARKERLEEQAEDDEDEDE